MTPDAPTTRNVPALLAGLHTEKATATVLVSGTPGGAIHVRDGMVVGMETPGAPGVEVLLLKSHRIAEEDWTAVRATGADPARVALELVAGGLLGAAELEITGRAALFDAAFALALTSPDGWEVTAPRSLLDTGTAVSPDRLVTENARRLRLLANERGATARFARDRLEPAPEARDPRRVARLSARHRTVLTAADGRRTPRDIAFTLGRGLFAVLLDLRDLLAEGFLRSPAAAPAPRPSTAPRTSPAATAAAPHPTAAPLPRRKR
ncbi:hypothetical protein [Streptomyces humi]|uniref:hypothetical protein n=1 Tax=Streptomyces humi TaxID=1428620 RepID=UPI0008FCA04C|nr:hypothetical protein [Streptomyces humi]